MPRYWFITALGCVIVITAIINYLNQPIEMASNQSVAAVSTVGAPNPTATLSGETSIAIGSPSTQETSPITTQVSTLSAAELDDRRAALATGLHQVERQSTAADAADDLDQSPDEIQLVLTELAAPPATQPDQQPVSATGDEGSIRPETPASSEIDVKTAARSVIADGSPPSSDVDAPSAWLVETSGGLTASQIGRTNRTATEANTLLVAKSDDLTSTPLANTTLLAAGNDSADDDEVAAILAETAAQANENLGLPTDQPLASELVSATSADQPLSDSEATVASLPDPTDDITPSDQQPSAFRGWEASAANVPPSDGPMIAIIIDDLGWSARRTSMITTLSSDLTLAMLTDADDAPRQADQARELGHELLIHVPMQAAGSTIADGSQLDVAMSEEELRQAVDAAIGRIDGAIGINNHMGSLFTANETSMRIVLDQIRSHGLIFVDSLTTADSVAQGIAEDVGVPYLRRDVFLDNERDASAIAEQLTKLESIAESRGWAVGIGHPYIETIDALAAWIPTLNRKGIELIPVSTLIRMRLQDTQTAARPTNG